jgi:hypothetical protein
LNVVFIADYIVKKHCKPEYHCNEYKGYCCECDCDFSRKVACCSYAQELCDCYKKTEDEYDSEDEYGDEKEKYNDNYAIEAGECSDITDNSDEDDFGSVLRRIEDNGDYEQHIYTSRVGNKTYYRDAFQYTSYRETKYVEVLNIVR